MKMRTLTKILALLTFMISLFVGYSTFVVDHVETLTPTEAVTPVCYIKSSGKKYTRIEKAVQVANRIRKNIEEHEFNFDGQTMKVTISGGVAVFNHEDNPVQDPKDLVNQADQGLYMSKRNGRNQITYADPSVNILTEDEKK